MGNEFNRYIFAGLINTFIGYSAFFIFHQFWGMSPLFSNAASYAFGLAAAYLLNLFFVFKKGRHSLSSCFRFLVGFAIAYSVNAGTLHIIIKFNIVNANIAQLFAMAAYTITFFFINKHFVWKCYVQSFK